MVAKIIGKIEDAEISFSQAVFAFFGIIAIRFFLENLSSPSPSFPAVPDMLTLVHYALFYAGAFISTTLMLRLFVPDIKRISKATLFILPVMWLPPILDLILSHGAGYPMAYIFASGAALWRDFLTIGGSPLFGGVTPGIKTEMVIILVGTAGYVFVKTRSLVRTVVAAIAGYCIIFFWLAFPSIVALFACMIKVPLAATPSYLLIQEFAASHIMGRIVPPTEALSYVTATGMLFNAGISYLFYLFDTALFIVWAIAYRPRFLKEYIRNCRPERISSFFLLIGAGIFTAMKLEGVRAFGNWVDALALAALAIAYFCAWIFAVGVNDLADIEIDRVSNQGRPLVANTVADTEMRGANMFFLLWSFAGAFIVGYWAFFAMMLFTAAYYVYSAPPLRLKRVPLLATFFIALASLSAAAAGFYFASPVQFVSAFPGKFILLVLVFFTLLTNVKDIKDVEGDRAAGIATVPTLIKGYAGRATVGAMLAAAFLSVPVILGAAALFIPSLIAAAAGYYFVVAEPYREGRVFVVYFLYAIIAGIILWR
ncbi:MAG TPA: UbiA family prenyltransferase [Candidatus Paceibacterota bacterium]|nr:UbiA family prenyltransferase [Candidatus Paceibacterota bacterium]